MGFILLYSLIVLLVVEISVVLMRATGLDYDIARFQVVSLLTGTGFTTRESELILGHPVRRRIGIFLILFGAFSLAVVISCISAILAPDVHLVQLTVAATALLVVFVIVRSPSAGRFLSKRLSGTFRQSFQVHELSIREVLLLRENDAFVDVPLGEGSSLIGQTPDRLCGEFADLNVLLIRRGEVAIRDRRMRTPLEAGDVLYVYGDQGEIERRFARELREKRKSEEDEKQAASPV